MCQIFLKSRSLSLLETSGPVHACNWITLPFFVFGGTHTALNSLTLHGPVSVVSCVKSCVWLMDGACLPCLVVWGWGTLLVCHVRSVPIVSLNCQHENFDLQEARVIKLLSTAEIVRPGNYVDSSWNVMAHGNAREGKWRENWRMEWVASTLHTTSEHGVSSITTADAHTSAASSRLNWRLRRFKWARPFHRKTKSRFCACAITFQLASTAQPVCAANVMYCSSCVPVHVYDSAKPYICRF